MEETFSSLTLALQAKMLEMQKNKEKPLFRSERAELFNELYGFYERSYKKNSWNAYREWLKTNKFKHTSERVEQYKKDPSFRKQITVKSFCSFWFGFMKTQDLYYLISIAKDKENRGENFNRWLFWAIKNKE